LHRRRLRAVPAVPRHKRHLHAARAKGHQGTWRLAGRTGRSRADLIRVIVRRAVAAVARFPSRPQLTLPKEPSHEAIYDSSGFARSCFIGDAYAVKSHQRGDKNGLFASRVEPPHDQGRASTIDEVAVEGAAAR